MIQFRSTRFTQLAVAAALISTSMVGCKTAQMTDYTDFASFSDAADRSPASGVGSELGLTQKAYDELPAAQRRSAYGVVAKSVYERTGQKMTTSEVKAYLRANREVDAAVAHELMMSPGLADFFSTSTSSTVKSLRAEVEKASSGMSKYQTESKVAGLHSDGLSLGGASRASGEGSESINAIESAFLKKTAGNPEASAAVRDIVKGNEEAKNLYGFTVSSPETCVSLSKEGMKDYKLLVDELVEDGYQVKKAGGKPNACTMARAATLYQYKKLGRSFLGAKQAVKEMVYPCKYVPKSLAEQVDRQPASESEIRKACK